MFRCPDCQDDTNSLTIHAEIQTVIQVAPDESVEDSEQGDLEWDNDTTARCSCGWSGTVADMTVAEADESTDEERETNP